MPVILFQCWGLWFKHSGSILDLLAGVRKSAPQKKTWRVRASLRPRPPHRGKTLVIFHHGHGQSKGCPTYGQGHGHGVYRCVYVVYLGTRVLRGKTSTLVSSLLSSLGISLKPLCAAHTMSCHGCLHMSSHLFALASTAWIQTDLRGVSRGDTDGTTDWLNNLGFDVATMMSLRATMGMFRSSRVDITFKADDWLIWARLCRRYDFTL